MCGLRGGASGRILVKAEVVENPGEDEVELPHKKNAPRLKATDRPLEGEFLLRSAVFTGGVCRTVQAFRQCNSIAPLVFVLCYALSASAAHGARSTQSC
jgi:hypothetical protein